MESPFPGYFFDYLNNSDSDEIIKKIAPRVEFEPYRDLSGAVRLLFKANPYKLLLEEFLKSAVISLLEENQDQAIHGHFVRLDEKLCNEIQNLKRAKIEHDEVLNDTRLHNPQVFFSETFQKEWNEKFYAINDEMNQIQSLRRRIAIERGIVNAIQQ